jgi:integrase
MAHKKKMRKERGANWEPKVCYRTNRGKWMVDCGFKLDAGKRIRQLFDTEAEAVAWAADKKAEYLEILKGRKQDEKQGTFARLSSLTETQRKHIVEALSIVSEDTSKIIRALKFYEKHTTTADASRLVSDVFKEYMAAKAASGRRPRTINDAKGKLESFVAALKDRSIAEITTADVEGWLNDQGYTPATRNAYRVAIVGLFNHAVERRYREYNPAAVIKAVTVDQGLPEIHTTAQVKAILQAACKFVPVENIVEAREANGKVAKLKERPISDPIKILKARSKVVPYLAIGYFAGLRPENELANLDWKDVDFSAKTIRVSPATAKKRRQRYVDMSDNLIQWLVPYVQKEGKIGYSRTIFRTVREKASVEWSKDVMRHSFGSYLLAYNEDAPKTALQMGHTRVDVLFNHYRNLVKKKDAKDYWNIVPADSAKINQQPDQKVS